MAEYREYRPPDMARAILNGIPESSNVVAAEATIDNTTGVPHVTVELDGTPSERVLKFSFGGLKGENGNDGADGEGVEGELGTAAYEDAENFASALEFAALVIRVSTLERGDVGNVAEMANAIDDLTERVEALEQGGVTPTPTPTPTVSGRTLIL